MNKKGYIQTLEAIVAVLIIYITVTSLLSQNKQQNSATVPLDIKLTQQSVLNEIQTSDYYRGCVLQNNYSCIDNFINQSVSYKYNYNLSLCTQVNCTIPGIPDKEVYLRSIIISANLTKYNTTSVNLYIWKKI